MKRGVPMQIRWIAPELLICCTFSIPCPQLAAKQIWKDATQWKGWMMCAQQTTPDSFPALLSLPSDVLGTAAKALPQSTKEQLLAFAEGGSIAVPTMALAVLRQDLGPANLKD